MAGSSYSTQQSTGGGYSNSTPVQTPQSEWGLSLSQLLSALAGNQYNWAMQQFNNGMGITDSNINQYLQLAGQGAGLAQNLLSRYQNVFEPLMDQYIQQAGTYNSEGRQRFNMGQAESTVAQADQQGRDEAERKLQGFGINPNSGRYQDLLLTSRIQDAAARAGAGTQASLNTAATGRQMLQQAAQMGQNVPGMTVNALQSAYTGLTGAENAILGMLNTGANLTQSAAPYYNAADNAIKMPTNGTQARNQQQSTGKSSSVQTNPPQQPASDKNQRQPQQPGNQNNGQNGSGGPSNQTGANPKTIQNPYYNQPGPGILKPNGGTGDDKNGDYSPYPMVGSPNSQPYFDENGVVTPMGDPNFARDPGGNMYTPDTTQWDNLPQVQNWSLPQNTPQFQPEGAGSSGDFNVEQNYNPGASGAWSPASTTSPQPANPSNPWGDQNDITGSLPQQQTTTNDFWNNFQQPSGNYGQSGSGGDYQQYDNTQQSAPQNNGNGDYQQYDNYQPPQQSPSSGDYSGSYGYAGGGRVRSRGVLPTSGGAVPRHASPSQGRQTDDVSARLNAGEFVMPRDVVAHKGSEFFHNLIKKSRMARTGMSGPRARGQMKAPLPNMNRPSFVSRPMGA